MFPMTITINNHDQLNAVLSAIGGTAYTAKPECNAQAEPKATTAKKQKAEPAPAQAATPEPKAEPVPVADDAPQATYQDAAAAITKLSRLKGRETAVALLSEFGASKLPDVKPDQFADVIAKATALMGE